MEALTSLGCNSILKVDKDVLALKRSERHSKKRILWLSLAPEDITSFKIESLRDEIKSLTEIIDLPPCSIGSFIISKGTIGFLKVHTKAFMMDWTLLTTYCGMLSTIAGYVKRDRTSCLMTITLPLKESFRVDHERMIF